MQTVLLRRKETVCIKHQFIFWEKIKYHEFVICLICQESDKGEAEDKWKKNCLTFPSK